MRGYYIAILSASGQNAPIGTEYGTIRGAEFGRSGVGKYTISKAGAFPSTTFCLKPGGFRHGALGGETKASLVRLDNDTLELTVEDNGGNPVDGFSPMFVGAMVF